VQLDRVQAASARPVVTQSVTHKVVLKALSAGEEEVLIDDVECEFVEVWRRPVSKWARMFRPGLLARARLA
jgi:hypothetical protein